VAVLAVIGYHASLRGLGGGAIGVTWFFVLSGFLITTLLLEEADQDGIQLRRFYLRRALRLLPTLYIVLGTFLVISLFAASIDGRQFIASGLYFMNMFSLVYPHADRPVYLIHLWSLSLEEQFYLIWPLILVVVRRTRTLAAFAALAVALAIAQRVLVAYDVTQSAWLTLPFFSMDHFAVGAVLAHLRRGSRLEAIVRVRGVLLGAVGIAVFDVLTPESTLPLVRTIRPSISELAIAVVIAHVVTRPEGLLARGLRVRPAVYVGGLSYALYLWHLPFFELFTAEARPDMAPLVRQTLKLGLPILASIVTYHLAELPLRRLRARLRPVSEPAVVHVAPALDH